jgi:copper chaperone CopZ
MADSAVKDQLALIRIEGMHCHQCEKAIHKVLSAKPGVHEVEVDFNSRLASVLYDPGSVQISELMAGVSEAGYEAISFTQSTVGSSKS